MKLLDFGLAKLVDLQRQSESAEHAAVPAEEPPPSAPPVAAGAEPAETLPASAQFGIAQTAPMDAGLDLGSGGLTQAGAVVGTPRYMAPEMWQGKSATYRVDIYSLGVLLYELAAGHTPHLADNVPELRAAALDRDPPPLRSVAPAVLPRLAEIIDRCLRRAPEARYADAEALCRDLEALAAFEERKQAGLKLLRRVAIVGSALLLLGGGLFVRSKLARPKRLAPVQLAGMVYLKGGSFDMGSSPAEAQAALAECQRSEPDCIPEVYEREQPKRRVTLSPFYLDKTEVTNQEFARFLNIAHVDGVVAHDRLVRKDHQLLVDLHPKWSAITLKDKRFVVRPGFERKPALLVTWFGANLYCQSQGKRLPTEAQWEYAARGGGVFDHPWGNQPPRCDGVAFARRAGMPCYGAISNNVGAGSNDGTPDGGTTSPLVNLQTLLLELPDVGTMAMDVSPQGVHDLSGSAQEWVFDRYVAPYPDCGNCRDPVVDKESDTPMRAVRGGDYQSPSGFTRAAERARWKQEELAKSLGFRCAAAAVL